MPGVTYDTRVDFTFHGPVVLHVLTMPRPGGLWALKPVLSNDAILGTEKVTAIEQRVSPLATVAGVNGDRFASNGRPSGILIRNGALDQGPGYARSSIGLDATGALRVEKVRLLATWQGTGQRQALTAVNNSPSSSGTSLYTPAWGPATPAAPGSVEVVLEPFPPATPNVEVSGRVVSVGGGGGTPIPTDGAVLVARGAAATNRVRAEAPAGSTVHVRLILQPDWAGVTDALGGGPALVRRGKAIFDANEAFVANQLAAPEPRTAVGQLKDGRIVLVAADGRQPGYSTGMTNFELALALVKLGVVTGAALDGGGLDGDGVRWSSAQQALGQARRACRVGSAVDRLLRHPGARSSCLRALAERRRGRRDPAARVQGCAALDCQRRADRPGRSRRQSLAGPAAPGTYPLSWNGLTAEGTVETEGTWRWSLSATDDLGRASSFERVFTLNDTLGFAKAVPPSLSVPRRNARAVAQATLTRAATLTSRIETIGGALVRDLSKGVGAQPGTVTVSWDGRTDRGVVVHSGTFVARVTAKNELGSVSLAAKFGVRRTGK